MPILYVTCTVYIPRYPHPPLKSSSGNVRQVLHAILGEFRLGDIIEVAVDIWYNIWDIIYAKVIIRITKNEVKAKMTLEQIDIWWCREEVEGML